MIPGRKQAEHLKKDQGRAPGLSEKRIIDGGVVVKEEAAMGRERQCDSPQPGNFGSMERLNNAGFFPIG